MHLLGCMLYTPFLYYLNTCESGVLECSVREIVGLGVHDGEEEVPEAPPLEDEVEGLPAGTTPAPAGTEQSKVDQAQEEVVHQTLTYNKNATYIIQCLRYVVFEITEPLSSHTEC